MSDSAGVDAGSGADISNAIGAAGVVGLQYLNAIRNNVYPTSSVASTTGGLAVVSGSTSSSTILLFGALIAGVLALWVLLHRS